MNSIVNSCSPPQSAEAKQALEQVDVQVASLRANVTRLPQPLAGMMDKVAKDAVGDATASTIAQIADAMAQDVTGPCQQIVANRYPFFSKSERDVPMADFAKLFAPGGVIEKFYSANLDPLVNRAGKTWVWKPNPTSRKLSDTTLRQFQQAAEIRDAFFPTGGNVPNMSLEVKPLTLSSDAQAATLSINGANVMAQQGTPSPPRPSNGPAPARAGRPSQWRRTCPTASPAWSARAHGRCFVSSTPAPRSRAAIR